MKALVSPLETFDYEWIVSWNLVDDKYVPVKDTISGCVRVAQVEPDESIFDVAEPLFWVSCPENCVADEWYFKDSQFHKLPTNADIPVAPIVELP